MVKGLDGHDRVLFTRECYESAAFALSSIISEHRAILDSTVNLEHIPHVILTKLLRQHTHEELAICNQRINN